LIVCTSTLWSEIPNGGFKAPTIKEKFGDHLDGLALGITVNDPFDFPGNHFFSMTKLDQLILREWYLLCYFGLCVKFNTHMNTCVLQELEEKCKVP